MTTIAPIIDKFAIGDIITAYHKGFWQIIKIERRFIKKGDPGYMYRIVGPIGTEYNPLITYRLIAKNDGTLVPLSTKTASCDAMFCKLAKESITERISEIEQERTNLLSLLNTLK